MEIPPYWREENQPSDGRFVIRTEPGLDRKTVVCNVHGELFNGNGTCFWYDESGEAISFRGEPLCTLMLHPGSQEIETFRCVRHQELWSIEHYERTGQCLYLTPAEVRYLAAEQKAYKSFHTQISWQTIDETSNAQISTSNGQIYVSMWEESGSTRGGIFPPHIARNIAAGILTAADDAERQNKAIAWKSS